MQQQTWSSGDYGTDRLDHRAAGRRARRGGRAGPGSPVLDVATGTGHVALEAARAFCPTDRDRLRARARRRRPRRAEAEGLDVALRSRRRRGAAVRRRSLRLRAVRDRHDVHRGPREGRRRAGAGLPPRGPDRPGQLDAVRLRRPDAQDRRQARRRRRRPPCRPPAGGRRGRRRALRRRASTTSRRTRPP